MLTYGVKGGISSISQNGGMKMQRAAPDRLLKIWKYAIEQREAKVVLMRHAKSWFQ